MIALGGLDHPERCAALGLSMREWAALATDDPRTLDDAALVCHGATRTAEWLSAGRPEGDLAELVYVGDDGIGRIVRDTIAALPTPARWYAITRCMFIEIGRDALGCTSESPAWRPHLIRISGHVADEDLPHLVAHEVAHLFVHRPVLDLDAAPAPPVTREEHYAAALAIADGDPALIDMIARPRDRREREADRLADRWGFRPRDRSYTSGYHRRRRLREELADMTTDKEN